jgi:hypothetical protein
MHLLYGICWQIGRYLFVVVIVVVVAVIVVAVVVYEDDIHHHAVDGVVVDPLAAGRELPAAAIAECAVFA